MEWHNFNWQFKPENFKDIHLSFSFFFPTSQDVRSEFCDSPTVACGSFASIKVVVFSFEFCSCQAWVSDLWFWQITKKQHLVPNLFKHILFVMQDFIADFLEVHFRSPLNAILMMLEIQNLLH